MRRYHKNPLNFNGKTASIRFGRANRLKGMVDFRAPLLIGVRSTLLRAAAGDLAAVGMARIIADRNGFLRLQAASGRKRGR